MKRALLIPAILSALLASTTQPALAGAREVSGHFEGGYTCVQGNTWLALDLNARADGSMTGTFSFGSAKWFDGGQARTNAVPEGKFAVEGTWSGNHFILRPAYWIDHPDGFTMVGLTGDSDSSGQRLSGSIDFHGCSDFAVRRH